MNNKTGLQLKYVFRLIVIAIIAFMLINIWTSNNSSNNKTSVKLLSPNGGEIFKIGDKVSISWNSTNNIDDRIYIGLTTLDGKTITNEITNYLGGISDTGSYLWTIDPSILPGDYRIVVQTSDNSRYTYDTSDSSFTISAK
jgi:hypothetical protein